MCRLKAIYWTATVKQGQHFSFCAKSAYLILTRPYVQAFPLYSLVTTQMQKATFINFFPVVTFGISLNSKNRWSNNSIQYWVVSAGRKISYCVCWYCFLLFSKLTTYGKSVITITSSCLQILRSILLARYFPPSFEKLLNVKRELKKKR